MYPTIPMVRIVLLDIGTRSNRTRTHSFQTYSYSDFIYTFSHNSFQHIKLVFI
ncbi:hypothetical protein F383_33392 [Gossypium arboreum]|uniref:Uncharacterized protein n=1 Tax=Gossypium arboreum TaxID=29729 RepID=A0A0B0N4R7_GOSAR|nr:hypothetical protein F383_33392 [Gossypium arboreum]